MQPKNRYTDLPSLGKPKSDPPAQNPVIRKKFNSKEIGCTVTCIIRPFPSSAGDGISP